MKKILHLLLGFYFILKCYTINISGKVATSFENSPRLNEKFEFQSVFLHAEKEENNKVIFTNDKGEFTLLNLQDGRYFLTVNDNVYDYETILIEVENDEVKAYQYSIKNGKGLKLKYPIQIRPLLKIVYEEESPSILGSVVKSPYMIIIGMTVVMFLCMKMVPQDQLQEQFKEMNKTMNSYQKGNIFNNENTNNNLKK